MARRARLLLMELIMAHWYIGSYTAAAHPCAKVVQARRLKLVAQVRTNTTGQAAQRPRDKAGLTWRHISGRWWWRLRRWGWWRRLCTGQQTAGCQQYCTGAPPAAWAGACWQCSGVFLPLARHPSGTSAFLSLPSYTTMLQTHVHYSTKEAPDDQAYWLIEGSPAQPWCMACR